MIAQWTALIIGKMHLHAITQIALAEKIGVSREYVCSILNGKRNPVNAEEKFNKALDELISEKTKT